MPPLIRSREVAKRARGVRVPKPAPPKPPPRVAPCLICLRTGYCDPDVAH